LDLKLVIGLAFRVGLFGIGFVDRRERADVGSTFELDAKTLGSNKAADLMGRSVVVVVVVLVEVGQIASIGKSVLFIVSIAAVGSGFAFAFVFGLTDRFPGTNNGRSVLFIVGIAVVGFGFVTDSFAGTQHGRSVLLVVGITTIDKLFVVGLIDEIFIAVIDPVVVLDKVVVTVIESIRFALSQALAYVSFVIVSKRHHVFCRR
jgi:hypothetical protein